MTGPCTLRLCLRVCLVWLWSQVLVPGPGIEPGTSAVQAVVATGSLGSSLPVGDCENRQIRGRCGQPASFYSRGAASATPLEPSRDKQAGNGGQAEASEPQTRVPILPCCCQWTPCWCWEVCSLFLCKTEFRMAPTLGEGGANEVGV